MAKSLSITVHPSALSAEYLTVSDAMRQILDIISSLESVEAADDSERKIVWRLVEARTNSPPFTVVAEAFAKDPQVSVSFEADRVTKLYSLGVRELLAGEKPEWLEDETSKLLARAFKRNLNGIGLTDVRIDGEPSLTIAPTGAQAGLAALEHAKIDAREDLRRIEYGAVEGQVVGLTRYYNSPALLFQERLSNERVICALSVELAKQIGPQHAWSEVWDGQFLRVGGELLYGADGKLKRVNASYYEEIMWADVPISALKDIDALRGRTVQEHIDEFWGKQFG